MTSVPEFKELASLFLLIPLAFVVGVGAIFLLMIGRWVRRRSTLSSLFEPGVVPPVPVLAARRSLVVEQPHRWIAIRGSNLASVQEAVGLHNPIPCSWQEGMFEAREDKLFISPPVGGWILVVGHGLPDPADDVDDCFRYIAEMSRSLGQVQYFNVNRALSHHAWVLADRGRILRAYAWCGETVWNQGPVTAAEKELKLVCFDYGAERSEYGLRDTLFLNSEKVTRLAAAWSVDPTALDESVLEAYGVAGAPSPIRPH